MKSLRLLVVPVILAAFLLVACGGDSDDTLSPGSVLGSPTNGTAPTAPSDNDNGNDANGTGTGAQQQAPAPGSPAGGVGAILVDGESFAVSEVIRCEPFGEARDLDLIALSRGLEMFVYISTFGPVEMHDVDIQGSMGLFSAGAMLVSGAWYDSETDEVLSGPPFEVQGDRVTGATTMVDAFGGSDTIELQFDIPIPSDIEEC